MTHLERLIKQIRLYIFLAIITISGFVIALYFLMLNVVQLNQWISLSIAIVLGGCLAFYLAGTLSEFVHEPLGALWQAILHVSPDQSNAPAPNLEHVRFGRELVTSLSLQIYEMASRTGKVSTPESGTDIAKAAMGSLPVPLFIMNKEQSIIFANETAQKYIGLSAEELTGKNMYSILDLAFPTEDTLDSWLNGEAAKTVTASKSWDHVRLKLEDNKPLLQFDMAAYHNKDNPSGAETILVLFDHSKTYSQDDTDVAFVALAVHELRTPLTLLRGYIEVFEEELEGKLDPELTDFLNKMQASAQQLSGFVNNILNVARVEDNQLTLQLTEETWTTIVKNVCDDMNLRAKVHHKEIKYNIPDKLPTVGADRVSIYEVLANLLDNAIKYSGDGQTIEVTAHLTKDGLIETTVTDKGVGIPENVMSGLFEKFYRNHRNQSQIGGTGLGLYLSKAIIEAHGGNIWVRSKEGQGTVIGFTLQPYVMVAHKLKGKDNRDIVRGAHGWIKNHSLYRR